MLQTARMHTTENAMTHTPPESKAWPHAGAADRPSASGEQLGRDKPAPDVPPAAADDGMDEMAEPFPEAGRHEGDTPDRSPGRARAKDAERR